VHPRLQSGASSTECGWLRAGWEDSFVERIGTLRREEMRFVRNGNILEGSVAFLFLILPVWMTLVTFAVFSYRGNTLEPGKVFRAVALFNALRFPLVNLPGALGSIVNGKVSVRRIEGFLLREEIGNGRMVARVRPDEPVVREGDEGWAAAAASVAAGGGDDADKSVTRSAEAAAAAAGAAVATTAAAVPLALTDGARSGDEWYIRDASFRWGLYNSTEPPTLRDVSVDIRRGKLTAIVGVVRGGGVCRCFSYFRTSCLLVSFPLL
jgi:ATP-binding cassette subfamily C (CFTR/MRP) protein 1